MASSGIRVQFEEQSKAPSGDIEDEACLSLRVGAWAPESLLRLAA